MTLQGVKHGAANDTAAVFECKPCRLSVTETIKDDPDDRTLQ
jgi:hypothetical protein